jgi:zinc/manganese transport system permease protein
VSTTQIWPVVALAAFCSGVVACGYRPLLFSSVLPDVAAGRGLGAARMETGFLVVLAMATAVTVPIVGTLLIFSLMIGPPAAARCLCARPGWAMAASVVLALVIVWVAIACSYKTNWPIGFFVGTLSAACYALARLLAHRARRGARRMPR